MSPKSKLPGVEDLSFAPLDEAREGCACERVEVKSSKSSHNDRVACLSEVDDFEGAGRDTRSSNPQPSFDVSVDFATEAGFAAGGAQGDAVLGENVREPEGKEGEGLFEWVRSVEAGQTALLQAEWEIHTPSGVSWEEMPVMKS